MTNVTDDNLGRRLFQLQKEKAVEDAMEKIRHSTGTDRPSISTADNEILKFILGELWTSIDRPRWGSYSFTKLSKEDLIGLIIQGKYIKNKHTMTDDDLKALDAILSKSI
jgi:hypothetical protein